MGCDDDAPEARPWIRGPAETSQGPPEIEKHQATDARPDAGRYRDETDKQ